jgi:uncharacterized protein YjdB
MKSLNNKSGRKLAFLAGALPFALLTMLCIMACPMESETIAVTGVSLDKAALSLEVGGTDTLAATVAPKDADNKTVAWASSDPAIATVSEGLVTALAAGTATITATTEDGGKTASCAVTVRTPVVAVTGVALDQAALSLPIGETATLAVAVAPEDAANKAVAWASSDPAIATVNEGLVTALAAGTTTITATTEDGGKTASCAVTVTPAVVAVTGVSLDQTTLSLAVGGTAALTATVAPPTATNKTVAWASSDPAKATVSEAGLVTAVAAGTATITATTEDGQKTATCAMTVTVAVTGVTLSETTLSLVVGGTATLTATVAPATATNKTVIWTSSDPAKARVSNAGLVTAVATGTATITATTADGNKTASCAVTVTSAVVAVTGVSLSHATLSLAVGGTATLTATVAPATATNKAVTWSSSDMTKATVSEGLVTAVAAGTATITATTADGGKTATCAVTVTTPIAVTGVSLNQDALSLVVGGTATLTATVAPATATNKVATWASSAPAIARVNSAGLVTAMAVGTATITVTTADGGKTATCAVTVNPMAVTGVTLSETTLSLTVGGTATLTATIAPANATNKNVTWSSSDMTKATVSEGLVTAVAAGTATITVTTADGDHTETCIVTVTPVVVTGVNLNLTTLSLDEIGDTATLTATVAPANAANKAVTWSSSDTTIATVDNAGLVTAVAPGTATITVTTADGNKTASCEVSSVPGFVVVTGVSLDKTTLSLAVGGTETLGSTETLTATVAPPNATNKTVTWSSSDPTKATVSNAGLVTAVSVGTATITVTTEGGGKTANCAVTVESVAVTAVSLSESTLSLYIDGTATLTATVAPPNATNQAVSWTSSAPAVATVNNGMVSAVAPGTATITATTSDGNKTASCVVTVTIGPVDADGLTTALAMIPADKGNSADDPYTVELNETVDIASSTVWGVTVKNALDTLTTTQKYITLDLSWCFATGNTISGFTTPNANHFNIIKDNIYIVGIILPDTLTTISQESLSYWPSLKDVTLGSSLTSIGNGAFRDDPSLSEIIIPSSVQTIGTSAFRNSGLTSVTIPASVASIGNNTFNGCASLTSVTFLGNDTTIANANSFVNDLRAFYNTQATKQGTYIRTGTVWSKE